MAALDRSAVGRASRRRGAKRELQVRDFYREAGWDAHKISDSSLLDVIAARAAPMPDHGRGQLLYIEVKSTPGPWDHFGPAERQALLELAARAGAQARLFHWPKGVPVHKARIYRPDEWPTT